MCCNKNKTQSQYILKKCEKNTLFLFFLNCANFIIYKLVLKRLNSNAKQNIQNVKKNFFSIEQYKITCTFLMQTSFSSDRPIKQISTTAPSLTFKKELSYTKHPVKTLQTLPPGSPLDFLYLFLHLHTHNTKHPTKTTQMLHPSSPLNYLHLFLHLHPSNQECGSQGRETLSHHLLYVVLDDLVGLSRQLSLNIRTEIANQSNKRGWKSLMRFFLLNILTEQSSILCINCACFAVMLQITVLIWNYGVNKRFHD